MVYAAKGTKTNIIQVSQQLKDIMTAKPKHMQKIAQNTNTNTKRKQTSPSQKSFRDLRLFTIRVDEISTQQHLSKAADFLWLKAFRKDSSDLA